MKKFYIPIYICSNCTSGFSGLFPKKIEDVYDNNEQFDHHQKSMKKIDNIELSVLEEKELI